MSRFMSCGPRQSAPRRARGAAPSPWLCGGAAAGFAFAADQLSKAAALAAVSIPVEILPFLDLVLVRNRGISFGMMGGGAVPPWALIILALVLVVLMAFWLARAESPGVAAALGLIMGGALGNALDRIRHGAVTDFIDLHAGGWHWPAFNFADVAICSGVGLLMVASFRAAPTSRKGQ